MPPRRRVSARRQWSAGTSALALTAVALAGCASPPPDLTDPANRAEGSGTIVWVSSPTLRNASDDARQVLVDAFEQAYPSIKVDLQPGPDNSDRLREKLSGEISAGSVTPDVYSGDVVWPADFAQDGLALPLNGYLPDSFWSQFAKPGTPLADNTLIQAMSYRGKIYAVPYFIDEGFLFYRKDLLAQAGLPAPATWEQLVADANALKQRHLPYLFAWQGDAYEGLMCTWTELLADAYGGQSTPDSSAAIVDQSTATRLASPQALKALDFLRALINDGLSPADVSGYEEPQADSAFDNGTAAFLRSWDSSYANAISATSVIHDPAQVGVMPLPTFAGQQGVGFSVIGGWNLFVNPHSRNLTADLTFLRWMAGPQAQRILATQFSEIPSNYAVRTDPSVTLNNPVLAAATRTRLISRPSSAPGYGRLSPTIYLTLHKALPAKPNAHAADPCTTLLSAATQIDSTVRSTLPCDAAGGG
ncbi:extracellular solute-binding protein [Actinocrinis sp.]|uniref:extracellular solute-binding protein n=1 Tax=Actinocrinis sp. TaxID=1920516 RepID=UPI002CF7E606|nr:extracellular solute-binding protein [Actinocrinis sp.]HXR73623.1 extracellular solute-binding protein [Actinocrinis sp.]